MLAGRPRTDSLVSFRLGHGASLKPAKAVPRRIEVTQRSPHREGKDERNEDGGEGEEVVAGHGGLKIARLPCNHAQFAHNVVV